MIKAERKAQIARRQQYYGINKCIFLLGLAIVTTNILYNWEATLQFLNQWNFYSQMNGIKKFLIMFVIANFSFCIFLNILPYKKCKKEKILTIMIKSNCQDLICLK
ncbi:hypothetical protein [Candidatus Harpocratesius sp.]